MTRIKLISFTLLAFASIGLYSCVNSAEAKDAVFVNATSNWSSLEEAISSSKQNDKKILLDIYTDWCKWCKVMDQKTFADKEMQSFLKENYNTAKFNAESKEAIHFDGKEYTWVPGGRKGIHSLAMKLLNNSPSYPSFVVLDSDLKIIKVIKGYKTVEQFKLELI